MIQHEFIFHPGKWIGEGRIGFSASQETIHFYTRWVISKAATTGIDCSQEVEMQGGDQNMNNNFIFSHITPYSFDVHLENDILGIVDGKGVIDDRTIAWEFHGKGGLEGFEVYELQDNGDYMLHAEYSSTDQFRTVIDGRIWKKGDN